MTRRSALSPILAALAVAVGPLRAQQSSPSPAVDVDSAWRAFRTELVEVARTAARESVPEPRGLVMLVGTGPGRLEMQLAHANVSEAALGPVLEWARIGIPRFGPVDSALVVFRLEDEVDLGHTLGVGDQPQLANWPQIAARLRRFMEEHDMELRAGLTRVDLAILVAKEGDVPLVRVARSSGSALVDREAVTIARAMRFQPARVAGAPVDMVILYPMRFVPGN
jgi:TonB family protein